MASRPRAGSAMRPCTNSITFLPSFDGGACATDFRSLKRGLLLGMARIVASSWSQVPPTPKFLAYLAQFDKEHGRIQQKINIHDLFNVVDLLHTIGCTYTSSRRGLAGSTATVGYLGRSPTAESSPTLALYPIRAKKPCPQKFTGARK